MEWTKEKPTTPGWYWWRDSHPISSRHVVLVWLHIGKLHVDFLDGCADDCAVDQAYGQWAGPIAEPTERKEA